MSRYLDISVMPTVLESETARNSLAAGCKGFHESAFRSYQILAETKKILKAGAPPDVILSLIEIMEMGADGLHGYTTGKGQVTA